MAWTDELQQASFRGVPFGVLTSEGTFGRRQAVHEYPFRDAPWVEDIGRAARRITFRGFLISDSRIYGGGDVKAQRDRMVAAAEAKGPGALVHPTLGSLNVSCASLGVAERSDRGRYFELSFSFVESGERLFPSATSSFGDALGLTALGLDGAASGDFLARAVSSLKRGAAVVNQVVSTATKWATPALNLVRDATNLSHLASNLPGAFGRYFGGANVGGLGLLGAKGNQLFEAATSVSELIAAGTRARALVETAADVLLQTAAASRPREFATAAQGLAEAVNGACADPADAVRLLSALAVSPAPDPVIGSPVGEAMADMQGACNDLFRRAAVGALARAAGRYHPSSYDDAVAVRTHVIDLIDAEALAAGEIGEDATYQALRTLRRAVFDDLTSRGASLATMEAFSFPSPLPSLALANRIYRDASREEQLVRQVDPRHPLFMPTSFAALKR